MVLSSFITNARIRTSAQIIDKSLFVQVVKHRENLVEFLLTNRVVFVVVATRTTQRQAHPNGAHRLYPVDHVLSTPFLVDRPTLGVDSMISIESGRQDLTLRGIRQ